jgi:hypothetical protein
MQKDIRTEDNEDQPEKNSRDNGDDFHFQIMMWLMVNSNLELL